MSVEEKMSSKAHVTSLRKIKPQSRLKVLLIGMKNRPNTLVEHYISKLHGLKIILGCSLLKIY